LRWTLEVIFAEDQSRVRKDYSPLNLAMLSRLAVSLVQQDTSVNDNRRGKRLRAGWDETVLLKILTGYSRN
jgi:hypothetical protein